MTMTEPTAREINLSIISDMFKDANGFRPTMGRYNAMTDRELLVAMDDLQVDVVTSMEREAEMEVAALGRFETLLAGMRDTHSIDTKTALRWLVEAEVAVFDDHEVNGQDVEHVLWGMGVGFGDMETYVELLFPNHNAWKHA